MDEIERKRHMLHAQLKSYKHKVEQARRLIDDACLLIQKGYCAFSTGIDSLCLLDMLFTQGYRMDVLFGDEGWDYPESLVFLRQCETRYGFRTRLIRDLNAWRKSCHELARPDLSDVPDTAWGNPFTSWEYAWDSQHPERMPTCVYDGVFLGLLATESRARRITLRNGTRSLYRVKFAEGHAILASSGRDYEWHACPLARLTKEDIWAYIIEHDIPYNPVYDRLASLGVPLERRRVAALSYSGVAHWGSYAILKQGWPDLFNRFSSLFPGVRQFL